MTFNNIAIVYVKMPTELVFGISVKMMQLT